MKKLSSIALLIILPFVCFSQKKNETYIKDARKIAKSWLADVNNNKFANAYSILHQESIPKKNNDSIMWCNYMNLDQKEFGKLKKRTITNAQFVTEIEDQESGNKISGFFVFLEYASEYENIKKLIETILLQQDDKTKWKILDWRYHFESPSSEEENTPNEH